MNTPTGTRAVTLSPYLCCCVIILVLFVGTFIGARRSGLKGWTWLYAATLFLELFGAVPRFFLSAVIGVFVLTPIWIVFFILYAVIILFGLFATRQLPPVVGVLLQLVGGGTIGGLFAVIGGVLVFLVALAGSFGPLLWSVLNLIGLPGGATLTPRILGARTIGRHRELPQVQTAIQHLDAVFHQATGQHVKNVHNLFVLDVPVENAFAIGTALYLTQPLVNGRNPNPNIYPVLAHQLGHMHYGHERVALALRRLVLPPFHWLAQAVGQVAPGNMTMALASMSSGNSDAVLGMTILWILQLFFALAGGGIGLFILNPWWSEFWRQKEYEADSFAVLCGQGRDLINYLDGNRHTMDVATPYFFNPHAYVELRVDAILDQIQPTTPPQPPQRQHTTQPLVP